MKNKDIISKMTLEEKAMLCVGQDYWHSCEIERLNIPGITMSDGPHGLRVQKEKADNLGINQSEVSICFPAGSTVSNSWDKNIAYLLGKTLGEEASYEDVDIVLGPAINIKRSPLCGRNFEYFSEDPYLTGIMASKYVEGLEENNVGACVKHFAANNQENRRRTINAIVDERALREIYLKAFEMIVKRSKPTSIMSAYNRLNDDYCTENKYLLDILKREWNFDGIVITDWGAENDRVKGLLAGNELEMPGGRGNGVQEIINAVKNGIVKEEYLDEIVDRLLNVAIKLNKRENLDNINYDNHHEIARTIAEESIVLLKNENNILPLQNKKVALIGDMAKNPRYQGAGSSTINPYKIENAFDTFLEYGYEVDYAKGYERISLKEDSNLLEEAKKVALRNDVVVIFAGLTENYESEGMDRDNLNIPDNQNILINEICKINKNVIVVLSGGSPILMPWKENVKGIITGYLGGEAGGKAMVNCLIGKVNPSGKLSETYPLKLDDTPCYENYPGNEVTVEYKESIYVGYRYYDKTNTKVLFPFGYGLSYTEFDYSNLNIEEAEEEFIVSFKIKNVGKYKGKEISEIYIEPINSKIFRAKKELKGFEKTELDVGKEKTVQVIIPKDEFAFYDVESKKWKTQNGKYNILVGKSVLDIVLSKEISISNRDEIPYNNYPECYKTGNIKNVSDEDFESILGRKLPEKEIKLENITADNTLEQIKNTKVGKAIYENQISKMDKLMKEQNVNKATKVMMDMQKPLKKFYEKKNSSITKEMVDELIYIAKNNLEYDTCEFLKEYLK